VIGLVRGPGGALRRLAGEAVPLAAGLCVGALALAVVPPFVAAAVAVLAWIGVSFVLRRVRERPVLRALYRTALVAHVVFWTVQGFEARALEPPGAPAVTGRTEWGAAEAFRAGYGEAGFVLPAHTTLGGWGSRPRRIRMPPFAGLGVLGRRGRAWMGAVEGGAPRLPLFRRPAPDVPAELLGARAVVLRAGVGPDGAPPVGIVRLDLVTCDPDLADAVLAAVADLGFRRETLVVAATHTHSGPGGYSRAPLSIVAGTDHFNPATFDAIRDAAASALRRAHGDAVPARVTLLRGRDRRDGRPVLARSRRIEQHDDIEDLVLALRFDTRPWTPSGASRPIAVLLNYAIHPVLMRRRHLGLHRDLAGAIEDAFQARLSGSPPVLFLNGATADVAPRDEGLPETGRPRALATAFAEAVTFDEPDGPDAIDLDVRAAAVEVPLGTPRLVLTTGARGAFLDAHAARPLQGGAGAIAAKALALPLNVLVWSLGMPEVNAGFLWDGSVGVVVNMDAMVPDRRLRGGVIAFQDGRGRRFAILWSSAEGTQALGRTWRAGAARAGLDDVLVVGFAGGASGYLPTAAESRVDTYETRASLFPPGAANASAEAVGAALEALVR
jgi:hypothetical protein